MSTKSNTTETQLTEALLRAVAVFGYGLAVSSFARAWWHETTRWTLLILMISEGITFVLIILARAAARRDLSPLSILATVYALCFFALFDTQHTVRLIPEAAGMSLQIMGLALQLAAKITLGRSFGLLPASRGLVVAGPYRIVRHPIYLGYLFGHIGFLLVNFCWRNVAVLAVLYSAQIWRILREEEQLGVSENYRQYRQTVRWRLVPFVF